MKHSFALAESLCRLPQRRYEPLAPSREEQLMVSTANRLADMSQHAMPNNGECPSSGVELPTSRDHIDAVEFGLARQAVERTSRNLINVAKYSDISRDRF